MTARFRLAVVFLLVAGWWCCPAGVRSQEPGTAADPLVSKSFLEQMFRFRSMVVPAGETLSLEAGTLLVLRSGRLKVRCPKGKALVDLTAGEEVAADAFVPPNHLLLVPDSARYTVEALTLSLLLGMGIAPDQ